MSRLLFIVLISLESMTFIGYNETINFQFDNYSMSENPTETNLVPNKVRVEALLFVASGPVTSAQVAEALSLESNTVEEILRELQAEYEATRGFALQWHGGRVQVTTAPICAEDVERFLGLEELTRLSRAAVETLAIIAYRQPISRPGIDAVRGVSSDGVIKNLLNKGLIQEVGRAEGPGRPILFASTTEFLQHFGLASLEQLPPFELPESEETEPQNHILKD
jgi:segregation and condensation protein B